MAKHIYTLYVEAPILYGIDQLVIPSTLNFTELASFGLFDIAFPNLGDILSINDTPAAIQLNYYYVDALGNPTASIHNAWQQQFEAKGYPTQCRNVAISNGNECGEDQGFNPRDLMVDLHDIHNPDFFGDLAHFIITPVIAGLTTDIELLLLGLLPGESKYFFDFDLRANPTPTASNREVYFGKIRYEKKFLWILPISYTMSEKDGVAPIGYLPHSTYPGGYIDIEETFNKATENIPLNLPSNTFINPRYGFIPTVSALDIRRNNNDPLPEDYLKRYAGGATPEPILTTELDNFIVDFTANNNNSNEHISFQIRNGNWLAAEINEAANLIQDCSFTCGSNDIVGPQTICSSATYTINLPVNVANNWTISGSGATITSQTNSTVTILANSGARSSITLSANITSGICGNAVIPKTIRVGKPDTPTSISGYTTVNTGALVTYRSGTSNGATSYEWRLPYPYTTVSTFDYFGQNWQLQAPGNTTIARTFTGYGKNAGYVQVMGKNACGTGGAKLLYVQHASSGGGGGGGIPRIDPNDSVLEVSLYPNPTKGKVTVALTELTEYEGDPPTVIYAIKILDQNVYERKFYEYKDHLRSQELNVSYLNIGLNYVIVYTDTGTFTKKLMVY